MRSGTRPDGDPYPSSLLDGLRATSASQLVIAGMMAHMCVDASVRAASDLGFTCSLALDACATRDLQFGGETVDAARVQLADLAGLSGAFATVRTADHVCVEI